MDIEVLFILVIIGFCSFFFWKCIFNKIFKEPRRAKIASWVSAMVGAPLIYLFIQMLFIYAMFDFPEKEFDSKIWKNDPENRFELSKNLIDSNLLIGKTKDQVVQILGKTENFKADVWVYYLGFLPSPGNIDPDILQITFENEKVIKVMQRST